MTEQRGVKVKGLVHWSLQVNDLEESRRFYTEVLGMEDRGPVGPGMRCVQFGDIKVLLCKLGEPKNPERAQESQAHVAFLVSNEDLERAAANLSSWGVAVQTPSGPPETIKGVVEYRRDGVFIGRSLYFDDPSGNRLELHNPDFPD